MKNKDTNQWEGTINGYINTFIEKWDPAYFSHLVDTDENDGKDLRTVIYHEVKKLFKLIEPIFEEWAGSSRYVTGAWNTADDADDRHPGDEYWNDQRRTAW